MRTLVTVQKIAEIAPIEGADAIEKVRIKDWWCVAKKGEFKLDDWCLYFEIDSLLPVTNPAFSFLAKGTKEKKMSIDGVTYTGYRLKTIRLRGQVSQGLALPLITTLSVGGIYKGQPKEDLDVTEEFGVVKYEAPIPAQLVGKIKGNFPSFIPKTDEERVQNMGDIIKRHEGEEFYVTEKLDGSSMTAYMKDGNLGVCSRNLDLLETEGNTFWELANRYDLKSKLPEGIAIQGEAVGEGIQQNPLKITGHEFYVYNVYDFLKGEYYNYDDMKAFCEERDLKMVPLIDGHFILDEFYTQVPNLLEMANGITYIGTDTYQVGPKREGLVIRPVVEQRETIKGSEQRFSFKAISNDYLLGEKE